MTELTKDDLIEYWKKEALYQRDVNRKLLLSEAILEPIESFLAYYWEDVICERDDLKNRNYVLQLKISRLERKNKKLEIKLAKKEKING